MTNKTLDRANELNKEMNRVRCEINGIEAAFREVPERDRYMYPEQMKFPKIVFSLKERFHLKEEEKNESVAYIFNVNTLYGEEVRLYEGLVKVILEYLREKLEKMEKEFEGLGNEES